MHLTIGVKLFKKKKNLTYVEIIFINKKSYRLICNVIELQCKELFIKNRIIKRMNIGNLYTFCTNPLRQTQIEHWSHMPLLFFRRTVSNW